MAQFAYNKRAKFDYEILEKIEAGIRLRGFEVKALKTKNGHLQGAYVIVKDNTVWLVDAHIPAYQPGNVPKGYDPDRMRQLLLNKKEINHLIKKQGEKGLTVIPVSLYSKAGLVKVELAIAKSKKKFDKRESIKKRDVERDLGRRLKGR